MDKNISKIRKSVDENITKAGLTLKKLILFGSRARKSHDEFSDYDILIVVGEEISVEMKMSLFMAINNELAKKLIPSDIIIKSEKEFIEYSEKMGTVTYEAQKEGVAI
jgi:predicted nucleotidyltransferase